MIEEAQYGRRVMALTTGDRCVMGRIAHTGVSFVGSSLCDACAFLLTFIAFRLETGNCTRKIGYHRVSSLLVANPKEAFAYICLLFQFYFTSEIIQMGNNKNKTLEYTYQLYFSLLRISAFEHKPIATNLLSFVYT